MFKEKLIKAIQEGILLAVKYGIIVALIIYAINFSYQTYQMAINGQNAAVLIREYQVKGWLPSVTNNTIPEKK